MKTRFLSLLTIGLVMGTISFVSCNKNDPNNDPDGAPDKMANDASSFIGQFAVWDDDGNLEYITKGYQLNEADPTEISVICESWDTAVERFKDWMGEGANFKETATDITWKMHDEKGKSQGVAVLTKKTGDGLVAEAILPAEIPFVHTIRFIPRESWPNNDAIVFVTDIDACPELEDFFFGNVINIQQPDRHGTGDFVVMREYDEETNEKGILCRLPKGYDQDSNFWDLDEGYKKRRSSVATVKAISKIYRESPEFWDEIMDALDFDTRDYTYFCWDGDHSWWRGDYNYKKVNIKTGAVSDISIFHPNYKECWAYHFWPEKDKKTGEIKVNIDHKIYKKD